MKTTVRKNFVFTEETADYLEQLAEDSQKSMTAIVQDLIEEKYRALRVKKRVAAFEKMKGSATGLLEEFSVQSVKASMNV
ncbi:MAG: hypothetical protein U9P38_08165 [Campylobacterota bacterium]|nr:hypothetical protein [Campylobacterota bacterium]